MQQLNDEREKYLVEEERQANELKGKDEEASKTAEDDKKLALERKSVSRLSSVASHMKELESADELNMRQYAMKYIIPLLTEGMIDVWKVGPLDPVDYLAEYIFKKSGEAQWAQIEKNEKNGADNINIIKAFSLFLSYIIKDDKRHSLIIIKGK